MKVLIKKTKEIKEVKDGYALNYLIPQGLAVMADDQVLQKLKKEEQGKQVKYEQKLTKQKKLAEKLDKQTITIKTKANQQGDLYGSIGKQQIKKALKVKEKITIKLSEPIKKTGKFPIDIKIGSNDIKVSLEIKPS